MKNVKRVLSFILVLALSLSICVLGVGALKYSDVESNYAYSDEVQFLSDLEIIKGYPDGTYKAENTVTRAEAAAVIFRMLAGKESSSENYKGATDFSDVAKEHWACGYINFAVEMGIVNGYPDGTFGPEKQITYAEYVTMLARALGLDIGKDLSYPYGYIAEATVENVNYGVDLSADQPCSRGAVAKLTYNSILDATYRRIANNIYVTEKPTIAKNVLKLEVYEGVVTSIDLYDWAGNNAAGEGKIRITNTDKGKASSDTFDYDLDKSYLGKEVKIWYKPDSVTASGDKVYAIVEQKNAGMTLPHIVLKGAVDKNELKLTYALNDTDYTVKLDENCVFVENNEYIGDVNAIFGDEMNAVMFYPAGEVKDGGIRAWLPITYGFIDNDADGKYEFVTRNVYGFAEVSSITTSKIHLEGLSSIDRKGDNGKAYNWNVSLSDVEAEDWVLYYADGAVSEAGKTAKLATLMKGPAFEKNGLYGDTHYAEFEKLEFDAFELEEIIDHDRFVFDGAVYRAWSAGAEYLEDLEEAEVSDGFEIWYTNAFGGIIASAEAADVSTGDFLVITEINSKNLFSGDFEVKAVLDNGKESVFKVKSDKTKNNLTVYIDSEKTVQLPLVKENLRVGGLYEYKMNKSGVITELDLYTEAEYDEAGTYTTWVGDDSQIDIKRAHDYYYKKNSGKLNTENKDYILSDNAVVFVMKYKNDGTELEFDEAKVYVGSFPQIKTDENGEAWVVGAKEKDFSGTNEAKAIVVNVYASDFGISSVSETEDIAGYLRAVRRTGSVDKGYFYEYTIAFGDDVEAKLFSRAGKDIDDLEEIVEDDDLIDNEGWVKYMGSKAQVILFDIAHDGTITDMRVQARADADGVTGSTDGNDYYSSFMATAVSASKGRITVVAVDDGSATGSAKIAKGYTDEDVIDCALDSKEELYAVAKDCQVFIFDMDSTNQAKVEMGSLGDITKLQNDCGSLFSFAYDADEDEITAIFVNGTLIEK